MKNTQFKVEDVFGDVISKDNFSQEQITKPNIFFSENDVNINVKISFKIFKSGKKNILTLKLLLLLNIQIFKIKMNSNKKQSFCLGRRHFSCILNQNVYEKVNPKIKKLVKIIKGICSFCGRKKHQIFTE